MKNKGLMIVLSLALVAGLFACGGIAYAQGSVISSQDFTIGTAANAALPGNWKVDKASSVRTVGTYAAAASATEQRAGNSMPGNAANGIYNYGAGDETSVTDRAVGWISSSGGTSSGNLYAWFRNSTGSNLTSVDISYQIEKYRNGSNTAGFRIQMYYSTDGSTWTSAGSNFLTSFSADANNNGFTTAPGVTVSISAKTLTFATPIPVNGDFYLAWNYSVTSGTTTTNAQGLGIDNFSMGNPTAVTMADFSAAQTGDAVLLTWETASELNNRGFNLYRGTDPSAPDRQLNETLIPSQSPGNPGGFIYTWEDRADLVPGTTYFYWVEDVDMNGVATRHGPVSVDYGAPTAVRVLDAGAVTTLPLALPLISAGLLALAGLAAVGRRRS